MQENYIGKHHSIFRIVKNKAHNKGCELGRTAILQRPQRNRCVQRSQ